jgi:hypothetical protein
MTSSSQQNHSATVPSTASSTVDGHRSVPFRTVSVAAAVLLLTLGCARGALADDGQPASPPPVPAVSAGPSEWQTSGLDSTSITAVRLSADERTLTFDLSLQGGQDGCWRNPSATLGTDEGWTDHVARVDLLIESRLSQTSGACPEREPAQAAVTLPGALGSRDVVVNSFDSYTRDGQSLHKCGENGCHPAPTGCTPASYEQAMRAADSPRHTYRTERGCDGSWLVLDLSTNAGPVCDDPSNPACVRDVRTTRWFFRAATAGWQVIAATRSGGCTAVREAEPAFPETLCASLPPVS